MAKKYYHATNYANFSGIMAEDVIKAGIDGGVYLCETAKDACKFLTIRGEKRRGISIVSRNIESELNSKFVKLVKSGVIFCPISSKEVEVSYPLEDGGINIDGEIYLLLKGYSLKKERVFTTGNFTYKQKDIEETLSNRNAHLSHAYLSQLVDLGVKYTPVYGFTMTEDWLVKVGKVFKLEG